MHNHDTMEYSLVGFLTPFKIALAGLIMIYLDGDIATDRMSLMLKLLPYVQGNHLDLTLDQLLELTGDTRTISTGETVQKVLLRRLQAIKSLDALAMYILYLDRYLDEPNEAHPDIEDVHDHRAQIPRLIKRDSFFFSFFRKCFLSFDCMEFDEISREFEALQTWLSRSRQFQKLEQPPNYDDSILDESAVELDDASAFSSYIHDFVEKSHNNPNLMAYSDVDQVVQQHTKDIREKKKHLDPQIASLATSIEGQVPPSLHHMEYVIRHEARDSKALDYLHQYFDYTMHSDNRSMFHYALFSLATFHADFDCNLEACRAAEEAINMARESNDHAGLAYILSWLYSFLENRPRDKKLTQAFQDEQFGTQEQLLNFIKRRCSSNPTLYVLGQFSETKHIMATSGSLSQALESLFRGTFVQLHHDPQTISVDQCLLQSVIYSRMGIGALAMVPLDMALESDTDVPLTTVRDLKASLLLDRGRVFEATELSSDPIIQLRVAMHHEDSDQVERLLARFESNLVYPQLEYRYLELSWARTQKGFSSALLDSIQEQIEWIESRGLDVYWKLRFVLLYTECLIDQQPHSSRALSLTFKCVQQTEASGITVLLLEAIQLLAKVLVGSGNYTDAISVLDASMPKCCETENAELIGRGYSLLADAAIGYYRVSEISDLLNSANRYLHSALQWYSKVEKKRESRDLSAKLYHLAKLRKVDDATLHAYEKRALRERDREWE